MSSVGQITGTNGVYQMDGSKFDISTLMMSLGVERANGIEAQMVDQANAMKQRNNTIKTLSSLLATINAQKDSGDLYNSGSQTITDPNSGKSMAVKDYLQQNGIGMLDWDKSKGGSDWVWGKEEKQEAAEKIKATLDSLNSDSQTDMIRLQGLVNKRDQAFEMVTNLMKTFSQTQSAIVSNLR